MIRFFNFNILIRHKILFKLNNINNEEQMLEYISYVQDFLLNLSKTNPILFKYLMGLFFLDGYCYINSSERENDEEREIYNNVINLEDLLDKVYLVEISLTQLINNAIGYLRMPNKERYKTLANMSEDYLVKFSIASVFEKESLFKSLTIDEIIHNYRELTFDSSKNKYVSKHHENGLQRVLDILEALKIGNFNNYQSLLLEMVREYYKIQKILSNKFTEARQEEDDILIELIERNSLEEIVNKLSADEKLLSILVGDYLYHRISNIQIDEEALVMYENIVSDEVKTKLR